MSTTTSLSATTTRGYLGPLTTTWTPPPQCTVFGPGGNNISFVNFYLAQGCSAGAPHDATSCWPPALVTNAYPAVLNGYGFYSPGLVCPTGYVSACAHDPSHSKPTGTLSGLKNFNFQFPAVDGETIVGCCPTGMACAKAGNGFQTCSTLPTRGETISVGLCSKSLDAYTEVSRITIGQPSTNLWGPLVQLVYKATDISPATSTNGAAATTTTGSSSSSTPITSSSDDSGGLTNGAKIGIGVGVPLGVLFFAAIAFFFFRRRKAHYRPTPIEMPNAAPDENKSLINSRNPSPQPNKDQWKINRDAELDGQNAVLLHQKAELDSVPAPVIHELSGETSLR